MSTDQEHLDHPDLAGLLTGELDSASAVAAGVHLETCAQCRDELVEVAVGHGLLRRSARTLGDPGRHEDLPPLPLPPAPRARVLRRPTLAVAAAAAVVGVLVGGAVTAVVTQRDEQPPAVAPAPAPVAVAALEPYGAVPPTVRGEVELYAAEPGHTQVQIRTGDLSPAGGDSFYYAWLLDPATNKMLPLGQVGPEGGSFDVADSILASYSAVDISLEDDDGDPGHSVTSVLRGDL